MIQFAKLEPVTHNSEWKELVIRDNDHTPYNFRKGERKATAKIVFRDMPDATRCDPWLNVEVSELVTGPSGRIVEKTISITLDEQSRAKLIAYLTGDA